MDKEEKKKLKELEKKIGCRFRNRDLLKNALTHKSYANERRLEATFHNERLEFLGDAVLELVVSDLLMTKHRQAAEGELSKVRASLVNEKTLSDVARRFELGRFLFLGKGEEVCQGREKPSLLADALEALFGAVYLDRGFKKAYKVIRAIALQLFELVDTPEFYKDYKTLLQERAQSLFKSMPKYQLSQESGPDHDKTFEVQLSIRGQLVSTGVGKSKKNAEQNAAREALEAIGRGEIVAPEMASS